MPYRVKPSNRRRLWLHLKAKAKDVTRKHLLTTLIESIERGDYHYPSDWYVQIQWRNRENARDRIGEFESEMSLSKRSSDGFDKAVLLYLRGLL